MPKRPLTIFQIKIQGHLDANWGEWFDGLVITPENDGTTTLSGPLNDQTALHGILLKIRNMNLTLLSVNPAESNAQDESQTGGKGVTDTH